MSLPRSFVLDRIGGGRRSAVGPGGEVLCVCAFLGPRGATVDLLGEGGTFVARVSGGFMEVRDYHVRLLAGEKLRVLGIPPLLEVLSDRRAGTSVEVREERGGARSLTWRREGGIDGVLRTFPADAAEPWTLEVPPWSDPLRVLAVLLAAERLVHEIETAG